MTKKSIQIIVAIILALILLISSYTIYSNKINHDAKKLLQEVNLRKALIDTVAIYKNSRNELVKEKLSLQYDLNKLNKLNNELTTNQKELLARIKEENHKATVYSAALYNTQVKLDNLEKLVTSVDTINNVVIFADSTADIKYKFSVNNVLPLKHSNPTLIINNIEFPNKTFLSFQWKDNKKEGYPTSFVLSNSNKYFESYNIDSYVIPNINKDVVKPSTESKFRNWLKKNNQRILYVGIGMGSGILLKSIIK